MKTLYIHILPNSNAPDILLSEPYRCVIICENVVEDDFQNEVSKWLVDSGCLYALAWGNNASSWDDAVDVASLEKFDFGDIPDDKFVMTTWHDNQTLSEVFVCAKNHADHPTVDLKLTVILHIASQPNKTELIDLFNKSK